MANNQQAAGRKKESAAEYFKGVKKEMGKIGGSPRSSPPLWLPDRRPAISAETRRSPGLR